MNIRDELFDNQDLKYKSFHSKLVPNIDEKLIIGVRVPVLRKIAKTAAKNKTNPEQHYYYEEKMVQGLIIGYSKCSLEEYFKMLDSFVPLIDNWGVCDCVCSNLKFAQRPENRVPVWNYINKYICNDEYKTRFAIVMAMDYFLIDDYIDKVISMLRSIESDYYYVNMAVAWALSEAYIKYPHKIKNLLESKHLPIWVHNKTLSKICDSYRVSESDKIYIKSLKR